jgi:putative ABC transport system substrate-binding protein
MGRIGRRHFVGLLGGAAGWPLAARAQQPLRVIGLLASDSRDRRATRLRTFQQGLNETGYVEGQNIAVEYRWAEGRSDRLPAIAAELARRPVAVIASLGGIPSAMAAKAATQTIPIVFVIGGDPVELGLVAGVNRPGANVTGAITLNVELGPKRLELLHELAPAAMVMTLLVNPTNPNAHTQSRNLQAAARGLGRQLRVINVTSDDDFEAVFAALARRGDALVIGAGAPFIGRSEQLAALALRHAVPAIFQGDDFAEAGGLMSYGGSIVEAHRLAGLYTGRILNGEQPAGLPVQQVTKVELIINLKTAKALGLTVPLSLIGRADEVIE